ncbi:hypothetical protein [Nocardia fluminea]|nr:hypothetical protein [Nocardia fluminea]
MPATAPAAPAAEPRQVKTDWTPEEATKVIGELREENKSWRKKYGEAEPIIKAHEAAEDAAKTEIERATERAAAVEKANNDLITEVIAAKYGVPEADYDFLGTGSREEKDAKGARYAARFAPSSTPTPPPSDRPVESLRPGASPTPPAAPDTSYPDSWRPKPRRDRT